MHEALRKRVHRRENRPSDPSVRHLHPLHLHFFHFSPNRYLPDLRSLLLDLTDTIEGRTAARPVPEPTRIQPFNITAPKARIVSIPKIVRTKLLLHSPRPSPLVQIPKIEKARSVPKTTYEPSREHAELERIRDENHRRALQQLDRVRSSTSAISQTKKSSKTQQKLTQIQEERDKHLQFDHFRANPPPKSHVMLLPHSTRPRIRFLGEQNPGETQHRYSVERESIVQEAGGRRSSPPTRLRIGRQGRP